MSQITPTQKLIYFEALLNTARIILSPENKITFICSKTLVVLAARDLLVFYCLKYLGSLPAAYLWYTGPNGPFAAFSLCGIRVHYPS